MATVKVINSKASVKKATDYILDDEKTRDYLKFAKDCSTERAKQDMAMIKEIYNKKDGRTYQHFVVSFHEDEKITDLQVKEFAEELIERTRMFDDFQVVGAVHTDTKHKHAHFIVNSVAYTDGHKFQRTQQELQQLKELSNEMCRERGLTVNVKGRRFDGTEREETTSFDKDSYRALKKAEKRGNSWVLEVGQQVINVLKVATSKIDFIEKLNEKKIKTEWSDSRKYITFTDLSREQAGEKKCKVRNKKLEQHYNIDLSKDAIESQFELNREMVRTFTVVKNSAAKLNETRDTEVSKDDKKSVRAELERFKNHANTENNYYFERKRKMDQQDKLMKKQHNHREENDFERE